MNKWIGTGRVVADPEARATHSGTSVCTFRIAVQRRFANQQGVKESDFITCVAWRGTADYVEKYFHKGDKVLVEGAMQNRQYEAQDGSTRYVTEIVADNVEYLKGAHQSTQEEEHTERPTLTEIDDDEFPF